MIVGSLKLFWIPDGLKKYSWETLNCRWIGGFVSRDLTTFSAWNVKWMFLMVKREMLNFAITIIRETRIEVLVCCKLRFGGFLPVITWKIVKRSIFRETWSGWNLPLAPSTLRPSFFFLWFYVVCKVWLIYFFSPPELRVN